MTRERLEAERQQARMRLVDVEQTINKLQIEIQQRQADLIATRGSIATFDYLIETYAEEDPRAANHNALLRS